MKHFYKLFTILFLFTLILNAQNNENVRKYRIDGVSKSEEIISKKNPLNKSQLKKINGTNGITAETYFPLEDFEDEFDFPPTGWSSNGDEWEQAFDGYNSDYSAFAYGEEFTPTEKWLITPEIDLTTATTPFLKYYEQAYSGDLPSNHDVMISSNGGSSWNILRTTVGTTSWTLIEIDLSSYIGNNVKIAFIHSFDPQGQPGYGTEWYVDDVVVNDGCDGNEPVPACATLQSPTDGATLYQNFAAIFWSPPQNDATTQHVKIWKEVNGNEVVFYETDVGINTFGIGPFTNPAFENNTQYFWQVVPANCNNTAQNCPIWSFTTNDGEYNYGGGGSTQGSYYWANSTAGASGAASQPTFNWVDVSSGTDIIGSIGDNETQGPFNIGFSFNYFGNAYDQFYINSNGMIFFNDPGTVSISFSEQIPNNTSPDNMIAAYWKNLDPTNTNVTGKHLYYGSDNGNMVITYEKYPEKDGDVNGWITFQIILQPSGNIKVQYKDKGSSFLVDDETVGIENSDGTKGITYRFKGEGAPVFSSPLALEFGQDPNALPVELTTFTANVNDRIVSLNWETATEVNNYGFEIQRQTQVSSIENQGNWDKTRLRSTERKLTEASWEKISFVEGHGNSNSSKFYEYVDKTISYGKYNYRLKQIDIDGSFEYSDNVEADLGLPSKFELSQNFPNPFNPTTTIKYNIP